MYPGSVSHNASLELSRIREVIAPVLVAHKVALVDLEWLGASGGQTLRVTIERAGTLDASGGVTLDMCADVSRDISTALDVADVISQRYVLEVSSPGLDRKLRTSEEFQRFVGHGIKLKLKAPAEDGQKLLRGKLIATEPNVCVLVDGKEIYVSSDNISEARLVFELSTQPKKGKSKSSKSQVPMRR